jgi:hypothetical protein
VPTVRTPGYAPGDDDSESPGLQTPPEDSALRSAT